jgi:hypothetical protein
MESVRKTPKTENPNAPLTEPTIDPASKSDFDKDLSEKRSSMPSNNTLLYVGGAALLATGIYFATKK